LGVSEKLDNYTMPSTAFDVFLRFKNNLDSLSERTEYYVENLLDRGVDVLLYVGAYDWVCNWVGVERMVKTLSWKDSEEFHKQEWRKWYVDTTIPEAGRVKNAGGLTFLLINGAGHLVTQYFTLTREQADASFRRLWTSRWNPWIC
jgi:carboxypeptidase C (cathepsin A)